MKEIIIRQHGLETIDRHTDSIQSKEDNTKERPKEKCFEDEAMKRRETHVM